VLVAAITVFGALQVLPDRDPVETVAADDGPPPQLTAVEVAAQFLNELTVGQAEAAARLTDDAPAATAQLTQVWRTLAPTSVTADHTAFVAPAPDATTADEPFTLTWQLGPDRTWTYQNTLHMVKGEAGWRVRWQPAVVHPRLGAGQSLTVRNGAGQPAVVDRDGTPLLVWTANGTQAADPAVAPRLTGAMGRVVQGQGGVSGWYVAMVDAAGTELGVLHGTPTTPLTATLSVPVQKAAQAAVDSHQNPTVLVAIQPSTGDILAVAQNAAAGDAPVALNGLFPPGSTFKIATATAILEAGAGPGTVVPCPGQATVSQRPIENNERFELGDVPLRTAFAQSCNTTFAMRAAELPTDALSGAANQLGLGADFDIPGIATETGSVPAPANAVEQVENSIGQGRVQVSCFGLALVTGTVAAGRAVTPRLWRDIPTSVTVPYDPPPARVVGSLRTMMRDVVTSGTGKGLAGYGKVHGKTGTAEIDEATAHGWFAGYRDDIAFATLVQEGGSSSAAVEVTGKFLTTLS
jgi:membrane peptidoglycan carboxypeptidase